MVELVKKVYLFIFVAFKCQKLFFHNGAGGHFGFPPLEKNAGIFARDTGAKYFFKVSRKSNQSSKHLSQKVIIKVRFFTVLYICNELTNSENVVINTPSIKLLGVVSVWP